jgi:probable rRNA maturation factor
MPSDGNLILYRRAGAGLPKRDIRSFAGELRERVTGGRTFTCMITDDRELTRLNRFFRRKDAPTDVLSFPSGSPGALGELAISMNRAREQATEFGHSEFDEIRILMLHGVLHLLGMDHEKDRGAMARVERRWRQQFQLPAGLIERTVSRKSL